MPSINGAPSVADVMSIPTNRGGLAAAGQGIAQYFANQQQTIQQLQAQQASQLVQYKTYDQLTGGQYTPLIDQVLSQNPYGRRFVSPQNQGGMGQALQGQQPQGGQPSGLPVMGPMTGPMLPTVGMNGGAQMPPSSVGNAISPNVATSSNPMVSGGSSSFNTPFGTRNLSFTVPAAKAAETAAGTGAEIQTKANMAPQVAQGAAAQSSGSSMGEAQSQATIGSVRDTNQLRTMAQTLKNLTDLHAQLSNSKVAGVLPAAGDVYGSTLAENTKFIPSFLQGSVVPTDVQDKVGRFIAARNETLVKTQPLLTQQYGQAGSVRIMDSLLDLSKGELGDLSTPHAQFVGQAKGSLGTLYRIQLGSQQYAQDLAKAGQSWPSDPDEAAQEIYKRMPDLTDAQQKQLNGLVNSTLGQNAQSSGTSVGRPQFGQSQNQSQQGNTQKGQQLTRQTAMQILQAAGGDKDKARQMAKNMGYNF